MTIFPEEMGDELGGMSFEEVFEKHPKWVECVDTCWTDNCTGLFLKFYKFVKLRLHDPISRIKHEHRCENFVKTLSTDKLPEYLLKYSKHASSRTTKLSLA
jgi:hypothetical protein